MRGDLATWFAQCRLELPLGLGARVLCFNDVVASRTNRVRLSSSGAATTELSPDVDWLGEGMASTQPVAEHHELLDDKDT